MAKRAEWRSRVMVVFLAAVAVFGFAIVRNALDDNDQFPLAGRVIVSEPANMVIAGESCTGTGDLAPLTTGARLVITPTGQEPVATALEPGILTPNGACEFLFTATVAESTVYRFRIDGLPELTRDHYLIDTQGDRGRMELAPILRWD